MVRCIRRKPLNNKRIAREGEVAREARDTIEKRLGRSVISKEKASDHIRKIDEKKGNELPFE